MTWCGVAWPAFRYVFEFFSIDVFDVKIYEKYGKINNENDNLKNERHNMSIIVYGAEYIQLKQNT